MWSTRSAGTRKVAFTLCATITATTVLLGCENAGQGAVSGGAVGALGGLAVGSLTGSAGKGAAIGAVSGAIAGGVIGDQNRRAAEQQQQMRYGGNP